MKDTKKIAEKIEGLKAELAQAKQVEKQRKSDATRREVQHALAGSGLLALVRAGTLTGEQLSVEFRRIAERVESTVSVSLDNDGSH